MGQLRPKPHRRALTPKLFKAGLQFSWTPAYRHHPHKQLNFIRENPPKPPDVYPGSALLHGLPRTSTAQHQALTGRTVHGIDVFRDFRSGETHVIG